MCTGKLKMNVSTFIYLLDQTVIKTKEASYNNLYGLIKSTSKQQKKSAKKGLPREFLL